MWHNIPPGLRRFLARHDRLLTRPWPADGVVADKMAARASLGRYGEEVAARFLRFEGCAILARNFKHRRGGEVDLIARRKRLLLFIEVKTRRAGAKVRGFDAVDADKQELIERGANAWLKRLGTRELPWRFDVIEITVPDGKPPEINWIRDAF